MAYDRTTQRRPKNILRNGYFPKKASVTMTRTNVPVSCVGGEPSTSGSELGGVLTCLGPSSM